MNDRSVDDLVVALRREAGDVSDGRSFMARLPLEDDVLGPPTPRGRYAAGVVMAVASVLVAVVALGVLVHSRQPAPPPRSQSAAAPTPRPSVRAPHLSLARTRDYVVRGAAVRDGREVLSVDYAPTATTRYAGGTVTLYSRGDFAAPAFTGTAQTLLVGGHVAYFGSYRFERTLAWPVGRGRWVCVSGFLGAGNGTDQAVTLAAERAIAARVVVR